MCYNNKILKKERKFMEITEQLIKKSCSSTIYARGTEYFSEGRVHLRKREENLITAVVDGEELYNVNVKLSENAVGDCFCLAADVKSRRAV